MLAVLLADCKYMSKSGWMARKKLIDRFEKLRLRVPVDMTVLDEGQLIQL